MRLLRLDRVLEHHVEQPLRPLELGVVGQARSAEVRHGFVVGRERAIRRERRLDRGHRRIRQPGPFFVDLEVVGDPQRPRVLQRRVGLRDVEQAGAALRRRVVHVAHGGERNADEDAEFASVRLDEHLKGDVVGNLVGAERGRRREKRGDADCHETTKPRQHETALPFLLFTDARKLYTARLIVARQDSQSDAGFLLHPIYEFLAIIAFTHSGGGESVQRLHVLCACDRSKARQASRSTRRTMCG